MKMGSLNPFAILEFKKLQNFIIKIAIFHYEILLNNLPEREECSMIRLLHFLRLNKKRNFLFMSSQQLFSIILNFFQLINHSHL